MMTQTQTRVTEDGGHSQDRGQEEEWVGSSSDQRWGAFKPKALGSIELMA